MAGPIRQPIDIQSLERYVGQNVAEIQCPLSVKQFGYGQSNPTYKLTDKNGRHYVLRKRPPGQLLSQTAHKVDREYRIIHALEKTDVPVPKTYCLCQDKEVIGTDFYIMEFLDGRIFEDPSFPGVTAQERTLMWKDALRTLAKFHSVVPSSVGLELYGKPSGFYNRQLKTFTTVSSAQAKAKDKKTGVPVGAIPHFEDIVTFFSDPATQPKDRSTFVHGDYKIDNLIFHKTEPRVIGVLDWELSTIGHPLSDLSNLITPWTAANSVHTAKSGRSNPAFEVGACPGLPTKEEAVKWYAETAGWNPQSDLTWGEAFGVYRGSIIAQGIAARFALGQASSAKAQEYAAMVKPWSELCWNLIQDFKNGAKAKL